MNDSVKILCPYCYAPDIIMYMEGMNNTSAGTLAMPAGNVDNNNMELKCKSCSRTFKSGDGKLFQEPGSLPQPQYQSVANQPIKSANASSVASGIDEGEVISIIQTHGKINAIKFVKDNSEWGLKQSKDYVDNLMKQPGFIAGPKKGCFIATACYGDYNAPEVKLLRHYRDEVLQQSTRGRAFIKVYYTFSPPLANMLARSEKGKKMVRKYFLVPLIRFIKEG
ncbi:MAG: CFI-box-CTERM domain-containing protein [Taibaiella sp.]|jgi:hypothetical protein